MKSKISKPLTDFQEIIDALIPVASLTKVEKNTAISLKTKDKTYFILLDGFCILKRNDDNRTISSVSGPVIIGLGDIYSTDQSSFSLKAMTSLRFFQIPVNLFDKCIEQHQLWRQLCTILKWTLFSYHAYSQNLIHEENYHIACNLLQELINEESTLRLTTTALSYIQDRTLLSRTWILKILSDLKKGGFIETHRGILVSIKHLPNKY